MKLTISDPDLDRALKIAAIDCRVSASRLATQIIRHGLKQGHKCIWRTSPSCLVPFCFVCGGVNLEFARDLDESEAKAK